MTADVVTRTAPADLSAVPTEELVERFRRGVLATAAAVADLARLWAELHRRGADVSDLRGGILRWVPLVATAQLAPEAVLAFANRPTVLRALAGVPLAEQARLSKGGEVAVYVEGRDDPDMIPLTRLPATAVPLVIGDGFVRTPEEQRAAVLGRTPRKKADEGTGRTYRPRYDAATGVLHIGRMAVPLAEVMRAVAAEQGPDTLVRTDDGVPPETATAVLTAAEKERLQAAARKAKTDVGTVLRTALRAWGVI